MRKDFLLDGELSLSCQEMGVQLPPILSIKENMFF